MKKLVLGLLAVAVLVVSLGFMFKHLNATEQMYGGSYEECIAQELGDQTTCERVFTYYITIHSNLFVDPFKTFLTMNISPVFIIVNFTSLVRKSKEIISIPNSFCAIS